MRRKVVAFAFSALLALGVVSVVQALPDGGIGYDDVYYSDDTFTDIVGEYGMQCYGAPWHWGVRSAYVQASSWDCGPNGTGGGNLDCGSGFWICDYENPPNDFHNCRCV